MITIHLQSNPEITLRRLLSVLQKLSKLARWQRNKVDNNIFASHGIGQTFLSEGPACWEVKQIGSAFTEAQCSLATL